MKKIVMLFMSLLLVVGVAFATASPASATWSEPRSAASCTSDDSNVCLLVYWKRDSDNTGFQLLSVEIDGCDLNCFGVDGTSLKCMNQNGTVKWSKTGSDINLGHADAHLWTPNQIWSGATELKCVYTGKWHTIIGINYGFTDTVNRT